MAPAPRGAVSSSPDIGSAHWSTTKSLTALPIPSTPGAFKRRDGLTPRTYAALRDRALADPAGFYGAEAKARLEWMTPFTTVKDVSYAADDLHIRWFEDGVLNASANCIDRWLDTRADETAILFEGDDPSVSDAISFSQLHERVCRLANALKAKGVGKGDRVTIYLPMIPEAAYAMLACARIGAVHSVVFGGFSPDSLGGRIQDCASKLVITADEGVRGGKPIALKKNVDAALEKAPGVVETVIVVARTGADVPMTEGRDVAYEALVAEQPSDCVAGTDERGRPAVHPLHLG